MADAIPARRSSGRTTAALAVLLLVILPCGVIHHGDGQARYAQAKAIALYGRMDIPRSLVEGNPEAALIKRTANGRYYPVHGPGMPLIWAPFVWIALLGERILGLPLDALAGFLISLVNPALVLATWLLLRRRSEMIAGETGARLAGYLYLCATLALVYANTSFSEVVCGLAVLYCISSAALLDDSKPLVVAGLVAGMLCLIRYELLLFFPVVAALLALRRVWEPFYRSAAASLVGPAIAAALNWVQRGSPLRAGPGTLNDQFGPPWEGLVGYVTDPDKALWLYFPVLWLLLAAMAHARGESRLRPLIIGTAALWLVFLPLYAASVFQGNPNWGGGLCYGTRHFVILMPLSVLIVSPFAATLALRTTLRARTAIYAPMIVGLVIQIPGISVKSEQAEILARVTGQPIVVTQAKVLGLKLRRGPASPELYRRSDLVKILPGEDDPVTDFRNRRTFRWLHHWWGIALSSKLQGYPLLQSGHGSHTCCLDGVSDWAHAPQHHDAMHRHSAVIGDGRRGDTTDTNVKARRAVLL